ncbi:hypothetical protein KJ671_01915 [Patescibacteria group bacterium]|nr:hypothetical protein [Patescibacteria group bacterium]
MLGGDMKDRNNANQKTIIESTGTREIIDDIKSFEFVDKARVISISKSEKQIWPKIEIIIADDYSFKKEYIDKIKMVCMKYEFPTTQTVLIKKNITISC